MGTHRAFLWVLLVQVGTALGQAGLSEPPDFPAQWPGPAVSLNAEGCYLLASGTIIPGDVDWVRVTMPQASSRTVIDVDFPNGPAGSALHATVVGVRTGFNSSDGNGSRDNLCGLGSASLPLGDPGDSAVDLLATPRNAVIDIGVTGTGDTGFAGLHNQTFAYELWVYALPIACATDEDCTDGVACTADQCDTDTGLCSNAVIDAFCDNGLACDGSEWCHGTLGCRPGVAQACDDGVDCTIDYCDSESDACFHELDDSFCENGSFCDGGEWCDPTLGCQAGEPPDCDDGVPCTVDNCDPFGEGCSHTPDHDLCDNGIFCDGVEWCDGVAGCVGGEEPCSAKYCREGDHHCADCLSNDDCDDGVFCNGKEACNASGSCVSGESPCSPREECNELAGRCETAAVTMDILPGQCPNRFPQHVRGPLLVVLVGSESFDVRTVALGSLMLARADGVGAPIAPGVGPGGPQQRLRDLATPFLGEACECRNQQGDGIPDLPLWFDEEKIARALKFHEARPGTTLELVLLGQFRDGTPFLASDCLVVPRPPRPGRQ